jgi:hypothetical protein
MWRIRLRRLATSVAGPGLGGSGQPCEFAAVGGFGDDDGCRDGLVSGVGAVGVQVGSVLFVEQDAAGVQVVVNPGQGVVDVLRRDQPRQAGGVVGGLVAEQVGEGGAGEDHVPADVGVIGSGGGQGGDEQGAGGVVGRGSGQAEPSAGQAAGQTREFGAAGFGWRHGR